MISTLLALFGRSFAVTTNHLGQPEAEQDAFEAALRDAVRGTERSMARATRTDVGTAVAIPDHHPPADVESASMPSSDADPHVRVTELPAPSDSENPIAAPSLVNPLAGATPIGAAMAVSSNVPKVEPTPLTVDASESGEVRGDTPVVDGVDEAPSTRPPSSRSPGGSASELGGDTPSPHGVRVATGSQRPDASDDTARVREESAGLAMSTLTALRMPQLVDVPFEPIRWLETGEPERGFLPRPTSTMSTAIDATERPRVWTASPLASDSTRPVANAGLAAVDGRSVRSFPVAPDVHVRADHVESPTITSLADQSPPPVDRSVVVTSATPSARAEASTAASDEPTGEGDAVRGAGRPSTTASASQGTSVTNDFPPPPSATATGRDASTSGPRSEVSSTQRLALLEGARAGEVASVRPRSSVTLRVDDDSGAGARIRVAVRGDHVRTAIVHDDPAVVSRLASQADQLRHSLTARGFGESTLTVHASPTSSVVSPPSSTDVADDAARSSQREFQALDRGPEDDRRGEDRESRRQHGRARDRSPRERER